MQTLTVPDVADGMAGRDPVGRAWSRRYDPAAQRACRAAADLLSGECSGDAPASPTNGADPVTGTEPPVSWALVAAVGELAWPDGRSDVLRAVADAWCRSAADLQHNARAADVSSAFRARCQTLARAHHSLGAACAGVAGELDRVHADIAAALTAHGLDARPRCASAQSPQAAITYASSTGPVEVATGWRIAAASGTVRVALAGFARAAETQSRALTLVGDLCADVSRLAVRSRSGRHAAPSTPLAYSA